MLSIPIRVVQYLLKFYEIEFFVEICVSDDEHDNLIISSYISTNVRKSEWNTSIKEIYGYFERDVTRKIFAIFVNIKFKRNNYHCKYIKKIPHMTLPKCMISLTLYGFCFTKKMFIDMLKQFKKLKKVSIKRCYYQKILQSNHKYIDEQIEILKYKLNEIVIGHDVHLEIQNIDGS